MCAFRNESGFENFFKKDGKQEYPEKNLLEQRERNNKPLNPHMETHTYMYI